MNSERDDVETRTAREAFAKLRASDGKNVPPFDRMMSARRPRVSTWWIAAPSMTVATAAAAAFVFWISRGDSDRSLSAGVAAPAASAVVASVVPSTRVRVDVPPDPLAFLLDSPSLTSMPDFDSNPILEPR
jgi:hypothetical protein